MANMLLLDVEKQELREVDCNKLEDYYREINCRCIDIREVSLINPKKKVSLDFDMIFDDEFLLKSGKQIPSVLRLNQNNIYLLGNVIICKHDRYGNTVGLSDDEKKYIEESLMYVPFDVVDEDLTITTHLKVLLVK